MIFLTVIRRLKTTSIGGRQFLKDCIKLFCGITIYSFGVYLTIAANIGLAPWDCLGMGIANCTPLSYGSAMVLIALVAISLQLLMKERIGFATVVDALLTGNLVQLFSDISPLPTNHNMWLGILIMLTGFVVIDIGAWLYMFAELGNGPKDGLLVVLGKQLPKIPIGVIGMILWSVVTLIGWMLGGSVGIGTVLSVFGAGVIMNLVYRFIGFEPRELKHRSIWDTVDYISSLNKRV